MEGLTMGLDVRLRHVYAENIRMYEETWHYGRYRMRWSTKYQINPDVDFNTRLVWEFFDWDEPDNQRTDVDLNQHIDWNEQIFDHFNIQFRNAFDMPLTLTVGRQDIVLGTGWLVLDGTPADGSRTAFFDAIRGTYELNDTTKLDMIYIQQYDGETKWLKPFNHREGGRHLTQKQDEKGLILYLTNKCGDQQRELYYIYKNDEPSEWSQARPILRLGLDDETHTIGGRLAGKLDENWSYSAEVAGQWGRSEDSMGEYSNMEGLGTNNTLTYAFNDEQSSKVFVMYEYLSGDDPTTGKNEKFNTLWGDWPQSGRGGDMQSYVWTNEGALGEVANLHRVGFGHEFKPSDVWTMKTMYNLMWADQNTFENATAPAAGGANSTAFSSGGDFRGQLFTGLLTYQCCKDFRTQFLVDYFVPGSYYDNGSQDGALFARVNVEWTF
jgi:hypothetical protein